MHETPISYLSDCLIMVGILALIIPPSAPILSLQILLLGRSETFLRSGRKPIHVHLNIKTYP
jgi:hypothetical protein